MKEKDIQDILGKNRVLAKHKFVCPNLNNFFIGQQDMISVDGKGMVIEYEIKISRSDFARDKKKGRDSRVMNAQVVGKLHANKVFYVVPEGMITVEEVPGWAGLMYITAKGSVVIKKVAPMIHDHKHDMEKLMAKIIRLYQERQYLGECLLTYKNRQSKEVYDRMNKLYPLPNAES